MHLHGRPTVVYPSLRAIQQRLQFFDGLFGFLDEFIRIDDDLLNKDGALRVDDWLGHGQTTGFTFDFVVRRRGVKMARRWAQAVRRGYEELQAAFTRPIDDRRVRTRLASVDSTEQGRVQDHWDAY